MIISYWDLFFLAVVDFAFQRATQPQKRRLLLELYCTELQLFKDLTEQNSHRLAHYIVFSCICFLSPPALFYLSVQIVQRGGETVVIVVILSYLAPVIVYCNFLMFNFFFQFVRDNFQAWITEIICPAVYDYCALAAFGERYCWVFHSTHGHIGILCNCW